MALIHSIDLGGCCNRAWTDVYRRTSKVSACKVSDNFKES